jgi:catechol 2,3-dioxygenase-like lactoylglutathione lyase family enzyme
MNTEITIHPKLEHYGLTTSKLDEMIDWYGKVLGMTVNHRSKIPAIAHYTSGAAIFRLRVHQQRRDGPSPRLIRDAEGCS